jgi:hypothetical protein
MIDQSLFGEEGIEHLRKVMRSVRPSDIVDISGILPRQKVDREIPAAMDSDDRFFWAMRALRQTTDNLQEIVTERRNPFANLALMERRMGRTQQETGANARKVDYRRLING